MKVKELKKYLEGMQDSGVVEISLTLEGEVSWWDFNFSRLSDDEHALIKPTRAVMC